MINNHKYFKIADVELCFFSIDNSILDRLVAWLGCFQQNLPANTNQIKITLTTLLKGEKTPFSIPKEAVKTYESDSANYYSVDNLWIVSFKEAGMVVVNRETYEIIGYAYTHFIYQSTWNFEDFFHPIFELLRQKKLYQLHGAAVSKDGVGILMPGKSGQGKTTLSIHLLDSGFDFLSDDRCFLRDSDNNTIDIFGFYEPLRVFSANISHIERLNEFAKTVPDDEYKYPLEIKELYKDKILEKATVKGILFPQWSPMDISRLEIISAGQALIQLLPLSVVCFDEVSTRQHFEFCSRLTSENPCGKIYLGRDRYMWASLVDEFILKCKR